MTVREPPSDTPAPLACAPNNEALLLSSGEGFELFPHFLRLLAKGEPVSVEALASSAGWPNEKVEGWAGSHGSQLGIEWDDAGRLVGLGLTLRPTRHRYTVNGRTFYTWCAADTLLFTIILRQRALAESSCPATGQLISVELAPDAVVSATPKEAVISEPASGETFGNLRAEVCDNGHYFASSAAARTWATAHPEGRILPVAEAFDHYRRACQERGWATPGVRAG